MRHLGAEGSISSFSHDDILPIQAVNPPHKRIRPTLPRTHQILLVGIMCVPPVYRDQVHPPLSPPSTHTHTPYKVNKQSRTLFKSGRCLSSGCGVGSYFSASGGFVDLWNSRRKHDGMALHSMMCRFLYRVGTFRNISVARRFGIIDSLEERLVELGRRRLPDRDGPSDPLCAPARGSPFFAQMAAAQVCPYLIPRPIDRGCVVF